MSKFSKFLLSFNGINKMEEGDGTISIEIASPSSESSS